MPSDVINDLFDVSGKTALVTGGTSGIGLMIARGLFDAGARVYVVARNADPGSDATADPSRTGHWRAMRGDLSTHEGICAIADTFASQETRLDILVNNAGLSESEQIDVYREETWDRALNLNLKAVFFLTQKLLPLLRTRALAQRLAPENINVNAIAPGVFQSRLTKGFSKELVSQITEGIPRGRFGTDQDIVGAVIYLTSPAGAYVTSSVLSVDGGWAGIS